MYNVERLDVYVRCHSNQNATIHQFFNSCVFICWSLLDLFVNDDEVWLEFSLMDKPIDPNGPMNSLGLHLVCRMFLDEMNPSEEFHFNGIGMEYYQVWLHVWLTVLEFKIYPFYLQNVVLEMKWNFGKWRKCRFDNFNFF